MFRSPKDVSVQQLETGIANIEALEDYYCDLCDEGPWSTESDVEIHRKSAHRWHLMKTLKDKNCHMCSICLREQKNKQSLKEHVLVHHLCCPPDATRINRQIFICDYCQHLFFNKQLLISHMYHWHTPKSDKDESKQFNCPKCWKLVRAKSTWFHLLYHGTFNISTCPICLRSCENKELMLMHIKSHPGFFFCDICGYETTKLFYLNKHMETHKKSVKSTANIDLGRFFLPHRVYPSLKNRMTHVFKGIPLSNAVHICVMCRALCVTKEEMRRHIQGDHMPEEKAKSKTHKCVCGEDFFNAVLLKQHIFKMKGFGDHQVWDGVTPITPPKKSVVYELYQITTSDSTEVNTIIISGSSDTEASMDSNQPISVECQPMES